MKGRCVICGAIGSLTRDHVPPRGVAPASPIEVRRLTAMIDGNHRTEEPVRRGFQAPTFPSLCLRCNTTLLGSAYDPALIEFANAFSSWVRGAHDLGLTLPDVAPLSVRPAAVARAVVGHLLAAEERSSLTDPLVDGTMVVAMREYFLAEHVFVPPFRIFVWPYPASEIAIVRGFSLARVLGETHGPIVGDVLKFFPVAFWVVGAAPSDVGFPFAELALAEAGVAQIEVPMRGIPSARWPELPSDQEVVLMNSERTHVATRGRRGAT